MSTWQQKDPLLAAQLWAAYWKVKYKHLKKSIEEVLQAED